VDWRRLRGEVGLALVAGAVLGAGAFALRAGADFPAQSISRTQEAPVDAAAVERRAHGGVLRADVEACGAQRVGTVTVLAGDGGPVGLTNEHVVDDARSVALSGPGGNGSGAVDGAVDHRDAALVELSGSTDAAALPPGVRPRVGDEVLVAGFPGGRYEAEWGTVRRFEERVGRGGLTTVMLVDVQANPGLSGGAVLDRAGTMTGLVAARDPGTGWTVAYPVGEVLGRPTEPLSVDC
jgi:S1-C subfamily serine protease